MSAIAAYAWNRTALDLSLSCSGDPTRGANLLHAAAIAFFGGIVTATLVLACAAKEKARAAALLFGSSLLAVALIFVALDSATYVQLDRACTDFGLGPAPTESAHLGYLYFAWGLVLAVLLVSAALTLRRSDDMYVSHDSPE